MTATSNSIAFNQIDSRRDQKNRKEMLISDQSKEMFDMFEDASKDKFRGSSKYAMQL
jgi:hypothetical protein